MRLRPLLWFTAAAGLLLLVAAMILRPATAEAQFIAPAPPSVDVLGTVQDAGSLARADRDLYASTFVATGFSTDGGTGGYAFTCNGPTCRYKLAEGSSMELVATGNDVSFVTSSVSLPTTFAGAIACKPNQSCFLYADPGSWMYFAPTADTSGCTNLKAGGIKFRSTDSRLINCDGTAARELTREVGGAVQLPSYTTATLPSASPAGRIVYDTDEECIKFTNGTTWLCV